MASNWAIIIGINQYRFMQPLKYAKRDAEAMVEFLRHEAGFDRIFLFTDDSPTENGKSTEPFRANLLRVLRQVFASPFMEDGDSFWFFFSGHGMSCNGQDYLMPIDGDPEDIENTCISTSTIVNSLRDCGADNAVMVLDACRSGSRKGEGIGRKTEAEVRQTGIISFFSCHPNESSYELAAIEQGAFTHTLIEGLGSRGKCATVERIDQYLQYRVPELVGQYLHGVSQNPYTIVEPLNRYHLILIPQYASQAEIATLKIDAYRAQNDEDWGLAQRLWLRVNVAALGQDMEAIGALQKLSSQRDRISLRRRREPPEAPDSSDTRRLDAAMPRTCETGRMTEVRAMIALPHSIGLKGYLPDQTEAGDLISKQDAVESQFPLLFPVDSETRKPQPRNIFISILAPGFTVEQPVRSLYVHPTQDSGVATFFVNPQRPQARGRIVVEVFHDAQRSIQLGSLTLITEVVVTQFVSTPAVWQLASVLMAEALSRQEALQRQRMFSTLELTEQQIEMLIGLELQRREAQEMERRHLEMERRHLEMESQTELAMERQRHLENARLARRQRRRTSLPLLWLSSYVISYGVTGFIIATQPPTTRFWIFVSAIILVLIGAIVTYISLIRGRTAGTTIEKIVRIVTWCFTLFLGFIAFVSLFLLLYLSNDSGVALLCGYTVIHISVAITGKLLRSFSKIHTFLILTGASALGLGLGVALRVISR